MKITKTTWFLRSSSFFRKEFGCAAYPSDNFPISDVYVAREHPTFSLSFLI